MESNAGPKSSSLTAAIKVPAPKAINPAITALGRVQRSPIAAPTTKGTAVPSPYSNAVSTTARYRPYTENVPRGDGRLTHDLDPQDVGPQDACGVFGVWAPGEEVAKLTYFGLYALQHRGQESAGIAVSNGRQILVYKDMGLVSQVFDETTLASLKGHLAVGHCRYSTTGSSVWKNAQPTFRPTADGSIALGHNGNLINTHELRA